MEGGSDGSPPQSLCMIRAAELFPKPQMEKEDTQLTVPFQELAGEFVKYLGRTDDGVLALSNYRIFLLKNSTNSETSVPLGLIELAQTRDLFHLIVNCKDASTVKCSFETAEQCSEWQRRIQLSIGVPEALESLFAFPFCSWICDNMTNAAITTQNGGDYVVGTGNGIENPPSSVCSMPDYSDRLQRASRYEDDFMREVERLGFDLNGSWRISNANDEFKLCPSYPQKILVPCCISDETLHNVANFRGSRRLPAVVWRHRKSGAVIARCSQPEVGWLGWRNSKDEQLLKALADACAFDRGEQTRRFAQTTSGQTIPSGESSSSSPDNSHEEVALDEVRKILIVDARSYTSAVTNRARGGGCECIEYYPCAEIEFMNLGNIHVIRKSFHALRQLCASPPDVPNWLGLLEKTMWLQHLSGLLAASMTVCHAIEKKGRPVLVHCSDGWDRTPQIVATAELCLDPFYRTVEGFRILVEREWLSYGHKFADRCGHGPGSDEVNERCPVFLQWLDLVHQMHKQFPCSFEFSMGYLIKLAQHSLSCLFGTFLCNTLKERIENSVFERTFSVWPFLSGPMYRNPLYVPNREKVLWPAHNVRDLSLWTEVYLGSLGNQNCIDFPTGNGDGLHGSMSPMAKTRSYGDLITAGFIQNGISRRSSDPNMTVDPNLTIGSNSENESIADIQSEREDSPDIIANLIHDTTKKLQNLTIELNNHDDKDFEGFAEKQIKNSKSNPPNLITENITKSYGETIQQLLLEGKDNVISLEKDNVINHVTNGQTTRLLSSSPQENNFNEIGCEFNGTTQVANAQHAEQNGFYQHLNTSHDGITNGIERHGSGRIVEESISGVTIHKADNMNLALIQSVDLDDPISNGITPLNGLSKSSNNADIQQDLWHGSVNTSTDTLVPVEYRQRAGSTTIEENHAPNREYDETDGDCTFLTEEYNATKTIGISYELSREENQQMNTKSHEMHNNTNYNILPKVHGNNCSDNSSHVQANVFVGDMATSSDKIANNYQNLLNQYIQTNQSNSSDFADSNNVTSTTIAQPLASTTSMTTTETPTPFDITQINNMEDSILILPEHQKLEISISGKCETIENIIPTPQSVVATTSTTKTTTIAAPAIGSGSYPLYTTMAGLGLTQTRRRRTSSSNSRRDGATSKQANGCTISRFSMAGVRSLPMTPPGLPDRPQIAISCPDGLAHALSEQNIRLQQIVHEHKLREDVLLREIHDMRMALLRKTCPHCHSAPATNDEQCSAFDNGENTSICSWEAVEDRSGPSSCASSSIQQPNAASVLWVPDHAVSRCTSCQTEFWLGRRKHHCRSCGQIFCADCSEFWAPLPDEKLFSPVRLCGPCYHSVTTRMQVSQFQNSALLHLQQTAAKTAANAVAAAAAQAAATSKA